MTGNGLYELSMVIRGMVYYCYTHISRNPTGIFWKVKLMLPDITHEIMKSKIGLDASGNSN